LPHLDTMIRKLRNNTNLDQDDIEAIRALPLQIKNLPANTNIVKEGDRPTHCCLIITGFGVRSKVTDGGKRQIVSVDVTGDIPDLQSLHLHVMDHDFRTLSDCTLGIIPHEPFRALIRARPIVAEAFWRETLVDAAIFREWIVNVGRRSAPQRLTHFMLEIKERMRAVGVATGSTFALPMTQSDLADALGLTPVHVNRVLKTLREEGVLEMKKAHVNLGDPDKLASIGDFNGIYLHAASEQRLDEAQGNRNALTPLPQRRASDRQTDAHGT
jgi:CRP-like cAMP-binding protein